MERLGLLLRGRETGLTFGGGGGSQCFRPSVSIPVCVHVVCVSVGFFSFSIFVLCPGFVSNLFLNHACLHGSRCFVSDRVPQLHCSVI